MFRTFQEEGIDLTMIDLEAYYTVRAFDNKYYYRINCSIETQFRLYGFTIFVNPKFISEKVPTTHYIGTSIEGYSSIFECKNTNYGKITIEKAESEQYLNGIYIERKKINYSNNTELMANEQHSIYKRDMDIDLPKETSDSYDIVIRKINSATTINELNLIEKHPIWRIISNNRNDIKELFNKKRLELNKNQK